ncbi:hypothetical protein GALL_447530 [mine drainage metagenome]|uniref:Uncharacterized protein n=1 Tax=mine drainage metagenome TaxID=410659 RepID=A0A1J5Q0Q9_9ZZZZ
MADSIVLDDVKSDLIRVQKFDCNSLVQRERLGIDLSFDKAVTPANRLVLIFSKLPSGAIEEFAFTQNQLIQATAKEIFNLFDQILQFKSTVGDAENQRASLIARLEAAYQPTFNKLYPLVSYAVARTVDFNELAAQGRGAVQSVRDETKKVFDELKQTSESAAAILQSVRDAAAEQGVTQEARYFADEAVIHTKTAGQWKIASIVMAGIVLAYSILTLFFTKIPLLTADTPATAIQLTASKFLVFVVLGYALIQCVKNYNANTHNAIINKHRQNSLMTYTTLTQAGNSPESRDIVLQHAAAAIYAPSDTGYVRNEERGYGDGALVGLLGKSISGGSLGHS